MPEGIPAVTETTGVLKNLMQLRELVYVPLRDSERSFVEAWFVDAMLNEAYLDINARLRLYQKSATGTFSASGTLAEPTDLVEITGLWVTDGDSNTIEMTVVGSDVYNSWAKPGANTPAAYLARVYAHTIETYPSMANLAYVLEYVARPTQMAQDTDTPTLLHPELTPRLVNYAIAKAKWQEGEVEEGNQYMAQYEAGLPASPRMLGTLHPEPLTFMAEPGPFDA